MLQKNPLEWLHVSKNSSKPAVSVTKKTTSPDDLQLFRASVGDVTRIEHDRAVLPSRRPRPVPRKQVLEQVDPLQKEVDHELETLLQEDKVAFIAPGLQKAVLKKLRKGYYGIDGDIDLHGQTSRQAQQHLLRFLHDCVERGWRCVQIIHGKGYNSPDQQPVLKNDLNLWLRQHRDVLAFCSTPPRAGGTGALYVLLKLSEKFATEDDWQ